MKSILKVLTFCSLTFSVDTHATLAKCLPLPLSETDCEPSAIVAGCVNVINGSFFDHEVDLSIPGVKPLELARSYSTSATPHCSLGGLWRDNQFTYLRSERVMPGARQVNYFEPSGSSSCYYAPGMDGACEYVYQSNLDRNNGATNAGREEISARTNFVNTRLFSEGWGSSSIQLSTGSGLKEAFFMVQSGDFNFYFLNNRVDPTGFVTQFEYDEEQNPSSVHVYNEDKSTLIGSLPLLSKPKTGLASAARNEVTLPDGRSLVYHYKNYKTKDTLSKKSASYISRVERPNAPDQSYDYIQKDGSLMCLIKRKSNPDNRFLEVEYLSTDQLAHAIPNYYEETVYRVKELKAPVGVDETPITTYRFSYEFKDLPGFTTKKRHRGATEVHDALNRKKRYSYDVNQFLTSIDTFLGTKRYDLHSSLKFNWIDSGPLRGALRGQVLCDGANNPIFTKFYTYDSKGNVIKESYQGNLTGNYSPILLDKEGVPTNNGADRYEVVYTYSKDHLNLKLSEGDFRSQKRYKYAERSDRLEAIFTCDENGVIREREFFEYDKNFVVIAKTVDDGNSEDARDLSGVSERRMTRVVPKMEAPYVGLPVEEEEFYFDTETGVEKSLGKKVFTYSSEGWKTREEVFDADGNYCYERVWEYNDFGQVVSEVDPLGQMTFKDYDSNGNLVYEYGPEPGSEKHYLYDFANRLVRKESLLGDEILTTRYTYDYIGNVTSMEDESGNVTRYFYNDLNLCTRIESPFGSSMKEYDVLGNVIREMEISGALTIKANNVRGQPVDVILPEGESEHYEYSVDGLLLRKRNTKGLISEYEYDYKKRLVRMDSYDAAGENVESASYTYNAFHLLSEKDSEGHETVYRYDGAGRKIQTIKAGKVTNYHYDALGRQYKISTPGIGSKVYEFDYLGRVVEERTEDEKGKILKQVGYAFDGNGNCSHTYHYLNDEVAVSQTYYNGKNLPILHIDAEGNQTSYLYDYRFSLGNGRFGVMTATRDPLGNVTEVVTDATGNEAMRVRKNTMGEIISKVTHTFDEVGNSIQDTIEVFQEGNLVRTVKNLRVYDSSSHLTAVIEAAGSEDQRINKYVYDEHGFRSEWIKPDGVIIHYDYDALGRLREVASSDDTVYYHITYDRVGNMVKIADHMGRLTKRTYDENHQLVKEMLGNGLTLEYSYDALGRRTRVALPDHTFIKYTYDAANLKAVSRAGYTHKYQQHDLSGNVLEESTPWFGGSINYAYNRNNQLIAMEQEDFSIKDVQYDPCGNVVGCNYDGTQLEYAYDSTGQIVSETGNADHVYSYDSLCNRLAKDEEQLEFNDLNEANEDAYDLCGNLLQCNGWNLKYDALNRLFEAEKEGTVYSYNYDVFNRRIVKHDNHENLFAYIYQDQVEIGSFKNKKIRDLRVVSEGENPKTAIVQSGWWVFIPLHDHAGNLTALVSPFWGTVYDYYKHTAFGEQLTQRKTSPWRFQDRRVDPETGLVHYEGRYYSPEKGRWLTPDYSRSTGGDNLYAFSENNPFVCKDSKGVSITKHCQLIKSALKSLKQEECSRAPHIDRSKDRQFAKPALHINR